MSNPDIKNYCHRAPDECNIVTTGAVQSIWFVCRTCKCEVSETMKNRLDAKDSVSTADETDDLSFWAGYPGKYP